MRTRLSLRERLIRKWNRQADNIDAVFLFEEVNSNRGKDRIDKRLLKSGEGK